MDAHWMKAKPETLELPEPCHLSLSLSLSLSRLALYCLCCVARGNKQTSMSICVCHPSTEIKRGRGGEAKEANKRIGEDGGCGEGVCAGVSGS